MRAGSNRLESGPTPNATTVSVDRALTRSFWAASQRTTVLLVASSVIEVAAPQPLAASERKMFWAVTLLSLFSIEAARAAGAQSPAAPQAGVRPPLMMREVVMPTLLRAASWVADNV